MNAFVCVGYLDFDGDDVDETRHHEYFGLDCENIAFLNDCYGNSDWSGAGWHLFSDGSPAHHVRSDDAVLLKAGPCIFLHCVFILNSG